MVLASSLSLLQNVAIVDGDHDDDDNDDDDDDDDDDGGGGDDDVGQQSE